MWLLTRWTPLAAQSHDSISSLRPMPLRAGLAWTRMSRSFGMPSLSIDETSANNTPIDLQILANEHLTSMHRTSNELCFGS